MKNTRSLFVPILSNGDGKVMVDFMMSFLVCLSQIPSLRAASFADSLVSRARNIAVCGFLKSECEYLLFWDADIIAMPGDIENLCENDDDILCGIYPKKQKELVPVFQTLPGHAETRCGGLIEVARSGTGFMRIHRSVFEAMKQPEIEYRNHGELQWDFFQCGVVNGEYLSEDWRFCDVARTLGLKVMVDTRIQLRHQGIATYPIIDIDRSSKMHVPTATTPPPCGTRATGGTKFERVC